MATDPSPLRGGLRDSLTIIMIFLALIYALPAWARESDNDLKMDMKMMIINGRSLPEKHIHTVNNNHTVRLFSEKEIVLPHSTGGSSRRADLHNHDSMIFQHSTFIHSEILKSETIIIALISQCQTCNYVSIPAMISQHSHSLATQYGSYFSLPESEISSYLTFFTNI